MDAEIPDPTRIQLKKYTDEDRTVIVAGNREFGPPQYKFEVQESHYGVFHELHGAPHSIHIAVRDSETKELVVSFYTRA